MRAAITTPATDANPAKKVKIVPYLLMSPFKPAIPTLSFPSPSCTTKQAHEWAHARHSQGQAAVGRAYLDRGNRALQPLERALQLLDSLLHH